MSEKICPSAIETIGETPLVALDRICADLDGRILAKLEFMNPGFSKKDRAARMIIEEAEREGLLKPGQTVVEATSGNTGIGLAMVCAAKGYPLIVTMADSFSIERRRLMRFLGAKVVLTPRALKGFGMYSKAKELAAELCEFPWGCLVNDRKALLDSYDMPTETAHRNEFRLGMQVINSGESREGAGEFTSGKGKGGVF